MNDFIEKTIQFVKEKMSGESTGHDWFHIERVYNNALLIAEHEDANLLVVQLASLLHDIADYKFHNGDEKMGGKVASEWLRKIGVDEQTLSSVSDIIDGLSFKGARTEEKELSLEGKVVQDADRLDAIGAIGISRVFAYGGKYGREIFNPDIQPEIHHTFQQYKNSINTSTSVNHFYEKLFLLKDKMNTQTAKRLAEKRHDFMEMFLDEFYEEWKGKR